MLWRPQSTGNWTQVSYIKTCSQFVELCLALKDLRQIQGSAGHFLQKQGNLELDLDSESPATSLARYRDSMDGHWAKRESKAPEYQGFMIPRVGCMGEGEESGKKISEHTFFLATGKVENAFFPTGKIPKNSSSCCDEMTSYPFQ